MPFGTGLYVTEWRTPSGIRSLALGQGGDFSWVGVPGGTPIPPTNLTNSGTPDRLQTFSVGFSGYSQYLYVDDFQFSVPSNAVISGIHLEFVRLTTNSTLDEHVIITNGLGTGNLVGENKADLILSWPVGSLYRGAMYGGSGDLWALSWNADKINASGFGFGIKIKNNNPDLSATEPKINYLGARIAFGLEAPEPPPKYLKINNLILKI